MTKKQPIPHTGEFTADWPHGHVTRGGLPARVICTDRKSDTYPVLALVPGQRGEENILSYAPDGAFCANATSCDDLLNRAPVLDVRGDPVPQWVLDAGLPLPVDELEFHGFGIPRKGLFGGALEECWTAREGQDGLGGAGRRSGTLSDVYYATHKPKTTYWSKPEHVPPVCWLRGKTGKCEQVLAVSGDHLMIFVRSGSICLFDGELENFRWSDRPFSRFEDGKPCTITP